MKTCSWCKQKRADSQFGLNRHGNPRNTCNPCYAEKQRISRETAENKKKIEYRFEAELVDWVNRHARMPNNTGQVRTIRSYSTAGWQDDILVIGREVECVCNPLFGNPMI